MRLNFSYVSLALVTSSADTGVGCSRLYLKRSTSLPFSTGVSLIGLAIINTYLCEISWAKVRKIIQKTTFGEDINTISTQKCAFCQEERYIEDGNSPRRQFNSIKRTKSPVMEGSRYQNRRNTLCGCLGGKFGIL